MAHGSLTGVSAPPENGAGAFLGSKTHNNVFGEGGFPSGARLKTESERAARAVRPTIHKPGYRHSFVFEIHKEQR